MPADFESFAPPILMKPWAHTLFAGGTPAASSMAGQYTQWKRVMSLPMMWRSAGQNFPNASPSG